MMRGFLLTRRNMLFSLVGLLLTATLTIWGCGGGSSSYDDPVTTTKTSSAVITPETVNQWIAEGKLNAPLGSPDRVVIVSPSTPADWTTKGHIPGAVRWGADELAKSRIEGLAMATNMMPDGPMMDGIIQRLGIDGNTTIVISLPKNSSIYNQSLAYWDLRYWGFPRERVKILNGGDDAWEFAGYTLSTDATEKYTESTYSVNQNAGLNASFRYSIGEMIAKIDALIADPTQKDTWQLIEVRGTATTPYITNALRQPSATMFMTRLNGDATKNFVYPDKATLEQRMLDLAVTDAADANARISATKKTIVMCGASTSASPTFILYDAVLGVPEGDIALYDGSSSQWNLYSAARIAAKYPTATAAQISAWAFDNAAAPIRAQGAIANNGDVSMFSVIAPVLGPTHPDMNQIEKEDEAYMVPAATAPAGGSSGGGDISGC